MRALIFLALLVSGAALAAPPNLALAWTGIAPGSDSMQLSCNGQITANAVSPTQLTDAGGNYLLAGAGDGVACMLAGVNAFGVGPASQLFIGVPGASPVLTVITQ